jgi:hypothetical protein
MSWSDLQLADAGSRFIWNSFVVCSRQLKAIQHLPLPHVFELTNSINWELQYWTLFVRYHFTKVYCMRSIHLRAPCTFR